MRCDECGREIRSDGGSLITIVDFEAAGFDARSVSQPLALCSACAARRKATLRFFLWASLLMVGGLILAAFLVGLVSN